MNAPLPTHLVNDADLDARLRAADGWLFLTGMQALVRIALDQARRDRSAGHNTGGYISGYRGSPLGRFDMELWREQKLLTEHNIVFRPAVNEDLAATAIWGSQHVGNFPGAKVDGVFGIWYGKGPGVDRAGDVLRHGNSAGTSKLGGVLCLAGDDHGAKSSTIANFSDPIMIAVGMPVLYPASVQELLDYGLHGLAMSRFSGCWVGMKVVTDVVESAATVRVGADSPAIVLPDVPQPPGGPHIRAFEFPLQAEDKLYHHKIPLALAYARANRLNTVPFDSPTARIGILTAGKAYQDVREALSGLGLDEAAATAAGVRLGKVGMVWPLDPEYIREFSKGLDAIIVIEEKRALLENQLKSILYDQRDANGARQPMVIGKFGASHEYAVGRGDIVVPSAGELNPVLVTRILAGVLGKMAPGLLPCAPATPATGATATPAAPAATAAPGPMRLPTFCSGCPHNRSTKVPEGSRALAGIGCHSIAALQNPQQTTTMSHMGGEGVMWLGQQPFTAEKHVFANMGDGTFFHSGFLAIRQSVAARVPITYKLLVNGFVSMTGGQPIDGELPVNRMIAELQAEGVKRIEVVTEDPERLQAMNLPANVTVHPRTEMDAVQKSLREYPDVSVLIYDQACATERRRLRKRGKLPDPDKRSFINSAVCEGCGDCGKTSNCLSVEPLETPLGRKRKINQSSCNKDFSCVEGFCPSFVTVQGAKLKKPAAATSARELAPPAVPAPKLPTLNGPCNLVVAGIGGTGVVTIGQIIAVAAHADGLHSSVLDVTGLSQKYGAVLSHVRIAAEAAQITASRIPPAGADAVIASDLIVAAGDEVLSRMRPGRTRVVVSTGIVPTSAFARDPDWQLDEGALIERLRGAIGTAPETAELARLATQLMGDAIAANMMLLGMAWQKGLVPLSEAAIARAIEVNGVQVEFNRRSFAWGRALAHEPEAVLKLAQSQQQAGTQVLQFMPRTKQTLDDFIASRSQLLTEWQNETVASDYAQRIAAVRRAVSAVGADERIVRAAAQQLFRLTGYKDEFEVARLHASPEFRAELDATFEPGYTLRYHVGAAPFAKVDPATGTVTKGEVGPWLLRAFGLLAGLRGLRGTIFDPFRNTAERKLALSLRDEYQQDLERVIRELRADNQEAVLALANWPEKVRGYGHVRATAAAQVRAKLPELREALSRSGAARAA